MTALSLLLRVLLCVSLAANGAGFAQAAVRMQLEHAVQKTVLAEADTSECRDAMVAAVDIGGLTHLSAHGDEAASAGTGTQDGMECCDPGTCEASCAQHPCAVAAALATAGLSALDARLDRAMANRHRSPRLPHLIRPPIA